MPADALFRLHVLQTAMGAASVTRSPIKVLGRFMHDHGDHDDPFYA
jgi:hypothetical protein